MCLAFFVGIGDIKVSKQSFSDCGMGQGEAEKE